MPSYEYGAPGNPEGPDPYDREHDYSTEDLTGDSEGYSDIDGITADDGDERPIPEELADVEPQAGTTPEATPQRPYTVVEIGSGRDPMLHYEMAPDIARLYSEGGKYVGVDASQRNLELGQRSSAGTMEGYLVEGSEVTAEFRQGTIEPEAPLPEALEPDSADRIIIRNVLTNYPIAIDPAACAAIAEAAHEVVRKDPAGEVVAVGTLTSDEFPAAAAVELFTAHGFDHIGPDDVSKYFPPDWAEHLEESAYAERFRVRTEQGSDAEGGVGVQETAPEAPFTMVEIGAGGAPILMDTDAPDTKRLYEQGGRYIGLDANPASQQAGAEVADLYVAVHANPEVEVETTFQEARITPETPLPAGLEPGSAHRVVMNNVLTDPRVEERPEVCQAIANAAAELIRRDGEVVVIGTATPYVFPPERVTQLMGSVGLEHVGSDDVSLHYPQGDRDNLPRGVYAERYRRASQPE